MLRLAVSIGRGFLKQNTADARATACRKFIDILEPDQRTVEYLSENLEVIKQRFMNLNKDVTGATVDEYARRVRLVIEDFTEWKADRGGWERRTAAKQSARPAGDGEKKPRAAKAEKPKAQEPASAASAEASSTSDPATRTVEIPLRKGVEAKLTLPREDFTMADVNTMADVKKIAWAMLSYASDFDPEVSPRETFPMLERRGEFRDSAQ